MLEITTPEMTKLLGGKEGMKPKDLYNAQMSFIKENAPILYDAIPLTSHAKFYENTMIGKSILNKFYKNTGKKYITDELSVEEALEQTRELLNTKNYLLLKNVFKNWLTWWIPVEMLGLKIKKQIY